MKKTKEAPLQKKQSAHTHTYTHACGSDRRNKKSHRVTQNNQQALLASILSLFDLNVGRWMPLRRPFLGFFAPIEGASGISGPETPPY